MRKNASVLCGRWLLAPLLASVSILAACSTSTKQYTPYQPPAPPADLAAPYADLPVIEQGDAQTVALWIVDTVESYKDCQAKQAGLVRAWPRNLNFSSQLKP